MSELIKAVAMAILSLLPTWRNDDGRARAQEYAKVIVEESLAVQPEMDPYLVVAVIFKESSFRRKVMGQKGEYGLMQILPGTFTKGMNKKELLNLRTNVRMGVGQLHHWRMTCDGEQDVWVSAFNSGQCGKTSYARKVRSIYCKIKPGGCGGNS